MQNLIVNGCNQMIVVLLVLVVVCVACLVFVIFQYDKNLAEQKQEIMDLQKTISNQNQIIDYVKRNAYVDMIIAIDKMEKSK